MPERSAYAERRSPPTGGDCYRSEAIVRGVGREPAHSAHFTVPAAPESVRVARHLLLATLRVWSLAVDPDTAELLLSEVVTNAILHGTDAAVRDAVVRIEFAETAFGLLVEVHDPGQCVIGDLPAATICGDPVSLAESGRGLDLVEILAAEWILVVNSRHAVRGR